MIANFPNKMNNLANMFAKVNFIVCLIWSKKAFKAEVQKGWADAAEYDKALSLM